VLLHCSAVNNIDLSALEMLEQLNQRLIEQGIKLHFSEVKIPVHKLLQRSGILEHLSGRIFLSQYDAYRQLSCD